MKKSMRPRGLARLVAPVAAMAALAVAAAPGNAFAAGHGTPPYPADLDGLLTDLVQYGDPGTWDAERSYAATWDNRHWSYQWGRAGIPTTSHVSARNDASGVTFSHLQVVPDGDPVTGPGASWFVGTSQLTNTTDSPMTLTSQGFSKAVTQTVSTTVTRQFSTSTKVSAEARLGDALKGGAEFTATWTWGESGTRTTSEEQTYTATPQQVPVPAHTTAVVRVVLLQTKSTGTVHLVGDLGGSFTRSLIRTDCNSGGACAPGHTVRSTTEPVYDRALAAVPLPPGVHLTDHHTVAVPGLGTYTAQTGAEFEVTVGYRPNGPAPAPAAASHPYAYTVAALKAGAPGR
ncbi:MULTISPECIES: ETX/MTX2 family pore-forming toxin [Streptomyces]|uniref:Uncharacterized protein n=1 Tax=Streptomyces luteosporeus TaxID=173856 RepID=A0ABN3U2Q8_9ACTN